MKQLMIIFSTILLGIAIFMMIAGDDNSVKSSISEFWRQEIQHQNTYP